MTIAGSGTASSIIGPIRLPLRIEAKEVPFELTLFTFEGQDGRWVSMVTGDVSRDPPAPLRIESACLFGHTFHSAKCDCGYQLDEALRRIAIAGRGTVLYAIDHDARGLGIEAHFRIYELRQRENLDTEEVYARLDAPVDARTYGPVAFMLRHLGIRGVELMSNNRARRAFLEGEGFRVVNAALEAKLDRHNMATLMLEKEDLGYTWSWKTHGDWLTPLQARVAEDVHRRAAQIVVANEEMVAEAMENDRDDWRLAERLVRMAPHEEAPREAREKDDFGPIVYLTDFPRVDELVRYARLGGYFVVVPFAAIPAWLDQAGRDVGLKIQDWGRRNRYMTSRPQWELVRRASGFDVYAREDAVRCVAEGPMAWEAMIARIGRDWPRVSPPASHDSIGWLELPRARAADILSSS